MDTNKKTKNAITILLHFLFWIVAFYFFTHNTLARPMLRVGYYKELIVFAMILFLVYFNYIFIFAILYKKRHLFFFWLTVVVSTMLISFIELAFIGNDLRHQIFSYNNSANQFLFMRGMYFSVFARNSLLVLFFMLLRFYEEAKLSEELNRRIFEIKSFYLRTRITPHYLVGVINTLQSRVLTMPQTLPPLLDKLNMVINYILTDAVEEYVTLNEEIVFYNNYVELELLNCVGAVNYDLETHNVDPELKIIPLLFECPINNAFKFTRKDGEGYINIKLYQPTPTQLVFYCENNISPDRHLMRSTGLGIKNLKDRLELSYPNCYDMTQEESNGVYYVTIRLTNLS